MSRLIATDAQLRAHIPNIIASVKGETPFIERLSLFLDLAEDWVKTLFTSTEPFDNICELPEDNSIRVWCSRLVVADALRRAIPSLDIVLTPNGFGIVSTSNIAPASKPRVDRLVGSMLSHRDDCISSLLTLLPRLNAWLISDRAEFFGTTLFPDLALVDSLGTVQGCRWEKYLELRQLIIDLESSLAEEWFSHELMSELRSENLRGALTGKRKTVARQIQAQIIAYLKGGTFSARRLADIVNCIRLNEESFSEWHQSETAKMFEPPVFTNEKKSSGYFF